MKVGEVISGRVLSIQNTHLIVELKDGWKGLLHVSKISDYYVPNIDSMFKQNERYWFQVIKVEEEERRVKLSWKLIMPRFVKDPFDFNLQETEGGFKKLLESTLLRVKDD